MHITANRSSARLALPLVIAAGAVAVGGCGAAPTRRGQPRKQQHSRA